MDAEWQNHSKTLDQLAGLILAGVTLSGQSFHHSFKTTVAPRYSEIQFIALALLTRQIAANVRNPPMVLKNYLLQLQISKKWEEVLRQATCTPKCRRNSHSLEFFSAEFGFSAL